MVDLHEGQRAVHAKGMLCAGTFTAAPAAATLSTAEHLQGQTVAAVARFSNASGNPHIADHARDGHGLAVKLRAELTERLTRGPARFELQIQIAGDTDPTDDPTALWPDERETVNAGALVFDPTRVTAGIELSDDPILHFRSRAYSVSVERRSGISRPPDLA